MAKKKLDISAEEAMERADVLFSQGEVEAGNEYLGMVISGGKKNAEVLFDFAVDVEDEKPYAAIKYYSKAIELEPKHSEACYGLGRCYGRVGELDKAIECFKKAIKHAPKDAKAYCGLGLALSHKGEHKQALAKMKKAIELEPDDSVDYQVYAMILSNKGDLKGALRQYRHSESIDKNLQVEYEIAKIKALIEDNGG
ncbi:MAG: tetratricopeptide repeat protein [Candidatus Altiarchaeota archaeon]